MTDDMDQTALPRIAAQVAPGSECDCRGDIPTESIHVEWEADLCWQTATIERCRNCAGVRGLSEVTSTDFRSLHTQTAQDGDSQ